MQYFEKCKLVDKLKKIKKNIILFFIISLKTANNYINMRFLVLINYYLLPIKVLKVVLPKIIKVLASKLLKLFQYYFIKY